MSGQLQALLSEITAPTTDGVFNVKRLSDQSAFYVGRNRRGFAAVLIATSGAGRTVPLRLAGIEAIFSTPCQIAETGVVVVERTLTEVICTNQDRDAETYFLSFIESLLPFLGTNPSTERVAAVVRQLVDLFQKLRAPARRPLIGLIGELNVIVAAGNTSTAVRSWRSDPDERFDFGVGRLRLDVKASSNRQRVHEISFEQANPPDGTMGVIASIWVEAMGGGTSVGELLGSIERAVEGDGDLIMRLRAIVAATLGDSLPQAMAWRFDASLARSSLRYFNAATIPAIRPPLPPSVSSARFVSDLSGCPSLEFSLFKSNLGATEGGLLPS